MLRSLHKAAPLRSKLTESAIHSHPSRALPAGLARSLPLPADMMPPRDDRVSNYRDGSPYGQGVEYDVHAAPHRMGPERPSAIEDAVEGAIPAEVGNIQDALAACRENEKDPAKGSSVSRHPSCTPSGNAVNGAEDGA